MIPLNKPHVTGQELQAIKAVLSSPHQHGNGPVTKQTEAIDKYSWVDLGSNYLMSEATASILNAPHRGTNAHLYYVKTDHKQDLTAYLKSCKITAAFHYVPLHSSPFGQQYRMINDTHTQKEAHRLVRLPLYSSLTNEVIMYICSCVNNFGLD